MEPNGRQLRLGMTGDDVRALHQKLNAIGLVIADSEEQTGTYGETTAAAVTRLQQGQRLHVTGAVDDATWAAVERMARTASTLVITSDHAPERGARSAPRKVSGTIYDQYGVPTAGLAVSLYHVGFACTAVALGRVVTGSDGSYEIGYAFDDVANLEVRATDPKGVEVALSRPVYRARDVEVLKLVCPASVRPAPTEHERLLADLARHVGAAELSGARENADCHDITLLSRASGWDARLVALAATAARLAKSTGASQEALYALLRVGMPADEYQLCRLSESTVDAAVDKARTAGVARLGDDAAARLKRALADTARRIRLSRPAAPGTLSTVGELLAASGLNAAEQEKFDQIVAAHTVTGEQLWLKAREAGLSERQVAALRTQGKLAQLTGNNARLIAALQTDLMRRTAAIGGDTGDGLPQLLVSGDFHQAQTWQGYLSGLAGGAERLGELIPPGYAGATAGDRLVAYAEDMARKIRLALPTHVVARRIETGELTVDRAADVVQVLRTAADDPQLKFRFSTTPTRTFLQRNPQLLSGIGNPQAVIDSLTTLHRVYQLSPSDQTMRVLMDEKLTSAHQIVAYDYDTFVHRYADKLGGKNIAGRIHRKSQLVSAVVYNAFAAAQHLSSTPATYAISAPEQVVQEAKDKLTQAFPTMESLFGDLDFCECADCQSLLSPAAYLVDLLHFIDPDPDTWQQTTAAWKTTHGVAYPFGSAAELAQWQADHPGTPVPAPMTPYEALVRRRPDLPNTALTCENTNTVLPYIDIVNEILEFSVAHQNEALPARDINGARSDDLLAEPQWVLGEAYPPLQQATYPLALPYDLALDTARRFLDKLDAPLPRVLEQLCPASDLDSADAPANRPDYGWRDVFREQLGIAPAEYALFTAVGADWHKLYGYPDAATARAELVNAKTLARCLGVSYRELGNLVNSWFVNPDLDRLGLLRKAGLETTDLMRYYGVNGVPPFDAKEKVAFEERLTDLGADYGVYNIKGWLDNGFAGHAFDRVLVLANPDTSCSFAHTVLRYLVDSGLPPDPYDQTLIRINLLLRLRRRLGWTLSEVDAALRALLPDAAPLGSALTTVLVYLAHVDALTRAAKFGRSGRIALLSLWGDMDPGRYERLFLTPDRGVKSAIFDNPLGQYLTNPAVLLADHLPEVRGALNITTDEIKLVLGAGFDAASLNLTTLSILDRHTVLAKALKLSVADVRVLAELSGVDPFGSMLPQSITTLEQDSPLRTLRFVELASALRAAGVKVEELDYVLRHRFDPAGPLRPGTERVYGIIRHVSDEVGRIRTEHAVPDDGLDFTDDVLAQKLALVLPADVTATFLGMWAGTIPYYAEQTVPAAAALTPAAFAAEPAVTVWYDPVRGRQHLTYRGVLVPAEAARLKTDHPVPLFASLLDQIQPQPAEYFQANLTKPTGFLDATDFDQVFGPPPPPAPEPPPVALQLESWQRERRHHLAEAFLPFLQNRLIREVIVATLAGEVSAPADLVRSLVTDTSLLTLDGSPLLDVVAQAGGGGLTVTYLDSTGGVLGSVLSTDGSAGAGPAGTADAVMEGYLEVPAAGAYRFFTTLPGGATGALHFDHLTEPLAADATGDLGFVELSASTPYHLRGVFNAVGTGPVALEFVAENFPRGLVGRLTCRPQATVDRITRAYLVLGKAIWFIVSLNLTEVEVRHVDQGFLTTLPTTAPPPPAVNPAPDFAPVRRLLEYRQLRQELNATGTDLIDVFRYAHRVLPAGESPTQVQDDVCARVAELTRRAVETVKDAATQLGYGLVTAPATDATDVTATGFTDPAGLYRLWRLLSLAKALGATPAAVGRWANPAPSISDADALRTTLKSRFDLDGWRRVAKPVSDKLRQARRDALVAFLMHRDGYASVEYLFEHFLVDPGTEPVVETSRIQLAITSVQTFIQRCLMNLEFGVRPQMINSRHWAWMKRFPIWVPSRRMFLTPENWLEPEFRDDKTHLFRQLEGELLQGDISADLAEDALYHYLTGLEKIARLEIVSTWLQEDPIDPAHNILHVLGRTYNKVNEYYYRRYQHRSWTPWEPVSAEVESDHVVLTIWRDRPYLFWLTFLNRAEPTSNALEVSTPNRIVDIQLHWAEYVNGEWVTAEATDLNRPLTGQVDTDWDPQTMFIHASTIVDDERDEVTIHLSLGGSPQQPAQSGSDVDINHLYFLPYASPRVAADYEYAGTGLIIGGFIFTRLSVVPRGFRLAGRNAPVEIRSSADAPQPPPFTWSGVQATRYSGNGPLTVWYTSRIEELGGKTTETKQPQTVLTKGGAFELVTPPGSVFTTGAPEIGSVIRPFFYQDEQHTFYVEPTLTERVFHEWDDWIIQVPSESPGYKVPPDLSKLDIQLYTPVPQPPDGISPVAIYAVQSPVTSPDSLLGSGVVVQFDDALIGSTGSLKLDLAKGTYHG